MKTTQDFDAERSVSPPCDCEQSGGYFYSGIPGILAHLEDGKLAPGGTVERCDQCERYPSDMVARAKLVELGLVPKSYALELDGPLFRTQRELLLRLHHAAGRGEPITLGPPERELLEGLLGLTDAIADQAADCHGIDCLLPEQEQGRGWHIPRYRVETERRVPRVDLSSN